MFRRSLVVPSILLSLADLVFAGNPVDIHGRLQTSGNRIIGAKSGDTVQLTGMSFFWSQWPEGGNFYNAKTVNWVVDDFKCSILRAAIGVGDDGKMGGDSATSYSQIDAVVKTATDRGVYSIIDWHSHYAIKNVAASKAFFENVAKKYGSNPGVVFELFNEPWANVYTWPEIKAYAQAVIPVIRKYSDNLIIVGTRQWSRDVDEASLDPIADKNVAYVLHFYAGSHRDTLTARGRTALANGVPLFVSEWGTTNEDGGTVDKAIYPEATNAWFAWMDSNKISSCNWSIQNKAEASAILKAGTSKLTGWSDSDLTPSGLFVRQLIRERNTQYTFEHPPIDSSALPGRIQAEAFSAKNELDVSPGAADDETRRLMNSQTTSWAEYDVNIPFRKKGVIALRVGTGMDSAAPIVKINGKVVAKIRFKNTGGWSVYTTVTSDSVILPAGASKVRVEYNGQFDFDWFEITGRRTTDQDPPTFDTLHQTVRIEAESFVAKKGMNIENAGDEDNTQGLGYTTDSCWAEYKALLPKGRQALALRVASENSKGSILKIKVNGSLKATVKVPATGGWKSWTTMVSDSFNLDATDTSTIRVEWSDTSHASSLVNLNWLEFRGPDIVIVGVAPRVAKSGLHAVANASGLAIDFGRSFTGTIQLVDLRGRILSERSISGLASTNLAAPSWKGMAVVRIISASGAQTIPVMRP